MLVADAGPLIALARLDLLVVLPETIGTLVVPEVVLQECLHDPDRPDALVVQQALDSDLLDVRSDEFSVTGNWPSALGAGELAAIQLAQTLDCPVLMDDRLARRFAVAVGLRVVGTAGVLLRAKQLGKIELVAPYLRILQASGYHMAPELVKRVLQMADE